MSDNQCYNVCVIGIGAMGGGMARSLLRSSSTRTVVGYDKSDTLNQTFFEEAQQVGKSSTLDKPPSSLHEAIVGGQCNVVVLVLVNEDQCQTVCFGTDETNVLECLKEFQTSDSTKECCVMLCSTVSPSWARQANEEFSSQKIMFVDCPISGGPVRANKGELTMMASGLEENLEFVKPLLDCMGKQVHYIQGGAGMGSTVKMVHQLLAGTHICCAAEALALGAKAGLDVKQLYDIVIGAARNSWMFQDRGKRMLQQQSKDSQVMSALDIFVKDLDIVHGEAKKLQSPIPIGSVVLQQFISGQSLNLGKQDDSSVVKVYETITGVPVCSSTENEMTTNEKQTKHDDDNNKKKEEEATNNTDDNDVWIMEDGTSEQIVEVGDEPRHYIVLNNQYTRVLKVHFDSGETTLAHRHAEDSLYFFLVEGGLSVINHVKGLNPQCDCMEFGEVRYGTHRTDKPLVHKITNTSSDKMFCIDAEVLMKPPLTCPLPLVAPHHTLIKTRDKIRVYELKLQPNEFVKDLSYPFFYLQVVLKGCTSLEKSFGGKLTWTVQPQLGDVSWNQPTWNLSLTNKDPTNDYVAYICEWR